MLLNKSYSTSFSATDLCLPWLQKQTQPYKRASQSGITPVAYFYETPLIVSNVNGLKEIIQRDKSGEVFNNTAKDLSKAILNSIKSDRQELYISNIRKSKVKYTWSRFIKELEII